MTMDITPLIPQGQKIIDSYGNGGFKVNGERLDGSILIFPESVENWNVEKFYDISEKNLSIIFEAENIDIFLLGYGEKQEFLSSKIENKFIKSQISIDVMNSGAAARTYNILLSEGRNVAAGIIAVS